MIKICYRNETRAIYKSNAKTLKEACEQAVAEFVDLSSAYLDHADLSGAFLHGAELTSSDLTCANLSGADLTGASMRGAILTGANLGNTNGFPPSPVIENLDSKILAAIKDGGSLFMGNWHDCETTHCRAGWAIRLAGTSGEELEDSFGSAIAGSLIYYASTGRVPDFYTDNHTAMADIKACTALAPLEARQS